MLGRLYGCTTILKGLAQDFQHVAAELQQCIQQERAMVRQWHFAGIGTYSPPLALHWR
jgi:hypothetical protein